MHRAGRSLLLVLGVVVAVVAVITGATMVAGEPASSRQAPGGNATGSGPPTRESGRSVAAAPGAASSQALPPPPDAAREPSVRSLVGVVVARGSDIVVERVDLPAPVIADTGGAPREVTAVYRLTVSAGPYVMRDMPAVLAADGVALGVAAESAGLESLVLYTYDDVVATQGATISLSYGLPADAPVEWSATLDVLP